MTLPKATRRQRSTHHDFHGEMRVRVNKRLHPDITSDEVKDYVQQILQGETIEGIEVKLFEVRSNDKTSEANTTDYDFAAGFPMQASKV